MNSKPTMGDRRRRGPGRPRTVPEVALEQAAAYRISVPIVKDTGDRYLSPNEVGRILDVSGEAVKQWIFRRKLPAVKLANGFWKVKVVDFETFLKTRSEIARRQVLITDGGNTGIDEIVAAAEASGHQAILAHNYPDALLKALDHFPALFVICLAPRDTECWKFVSNIRNHKSLRRFPILFIGGKKVSDSDTANALQFNAKGLLLRPLNVSVVQKEIDAIMRHTT